eukprot:6192955-Pleurochrysis_carterae.AAC.2
MMQSRLLINASDSSSLPICAFAVVADNTTTMAALVLAPLLSLSFTIHTPASLSRRAAQQSPLGSNLRTHSSQPLMVLPEDATDVSRRSLLVTGVTVAAALSTAPAATYAEGSAYPRLLIETTEGPMEFELWNDVAPKHVENFLTLAKQAQLHSWKALFARFVIQGGDPNSKLGYGPTGTLEGADKSKVAKWGRGGPGYNIKAEFNDRLHEFGVLSMARSNDPDSAGSQFFVCLGRLPSLDKKYTVFGKLTKGEDVLRRLGAAKTVAGDIPERRQGIQRVDPL